MASKKKKHSKYRGVTFHSNPAFQFWPWHARIMIARKSIGLGYFKTEKEAAEAYNKKAIIYGRKVNYIKTI